MPTTGSYSQESSSCPQGCSGCHAEVTGNRNLVICIDGTSNQFGDHSTNVLKLFTKIDLTTNFPKQLAYYSSGIGTGPQSSNILNRTGRAIFDKVDMAVAWNIEEIVKETYSWLARVYEKGDHIYLFGFSRGAYQVRILASMIHEVGLIRTQTEKQIRRAYDYYEAVHSGDPEARHMARKFKNTFSWMGVRVHFVGVWDTVSSVGLVKGNNLLSASSSAEQACHFRHALALDERRVKFMPEYLCEVNSRMSDGNYILTSTNVESKLRKSTMNDMGADLSGGKKNKTAVIKEVWFPGSHSDVGGADRSGKSHHAGNVSLLWMRQEAAVSGLVLQPTDIVWVPDDIDLGISDSMSPVWQLIEYMPITHQVSFSGPGDNARRIHRLQPRRIIPGQKVHASILFANVYNPLASLGDGFDISMLHPGVGVELDSRFWETGLFDDTAAEMLMTYLRGPQGVVPIYLDRLLFMLRFKEGRQCVRSVLDWQRQFLDLIQNCNCAPFVRLGATVAYYEASCDPDTDPESLALPHMELSQDAFDDAKKSLSAILAACNHWDGPRVVALLRPLTKHRVLREHILTQDILESLMSLLDVILSRTGGKFGQVMDYLTCLLQCEDTRGIVIEKLGANLPSSNVTRLFRILEVKDSDLLTAALRMMMTLAQIPEARPVCSIVKPRLGKLAQKDKGLVGLLSVEILLALYDPNEQAVQLSIRSANVRANLAGALVRLNPDRRDSANGEGCDVNPGQLVLRQLFGVDATELTDRHRRLIGELKRAIQNGNAQDRTAATLTILKLCESEIIRTFLREIDLLGTFINQLRRKKKALLAAYALATCLKFGDMKESIKDNELLPRNIVGMLRHDYFDDAVGHVEGFQIFGDFMQHDNLREQIKNYDITEVLNTKLVKGTPRETRTSLICLDIFRSFDQDGPWMRELVAKSLYHLRKPDWKVQKAGVIMLSALAQTEHGVAAIYPRVYEIVEMLLPEGYPLIQLTAPATSAASPSGTQTQLSAMPHLPTDTALPDSPDPSSRSPSRMMGPAWALRILAQNKTLRNTTHSTSEYGILKYLYLSGTLIDKMDTSPLRVSTPNRADVVNVLEKMIKAVDGELSEEDLMSIGDAVLPHIKHWDRIGELLIDKTVTAVAILPALLGVSALAILAVAATPAYLCVRVFMLLKKLVVHYQDSRILERLRGVRIPRALRHEHEGEGGEGGSPT